MTIRDRLVPRRAPHMTPFRPLRSLLFAPGNRPRMLAKVGTVGADAVVIDLEDAVPLDEKTDTRAVVREALESQDWRRVYVRINAIVARTDYSAASGLDDIEAVAMPALTGIILPKVDTPEDVFAAAESLAAAERRLDVEDGRFEIMPILETARGVLSAERIAGAHPRVRRLCFGAGDFTTDIGVEWTKDGLAYLYARSLVALASRAAECEPPVDTVFPDIHDGEGLRGDAELALKLGFQGKLAIYPAQVPIINGIFTPSSERVAEARRWIAAFEAALREAKASVTVDGKMLDYANVAQFRRLVAIADALETT